MRQFTNLQGSATSRKRSRFASCRRSGSALQRVQASPQWPESHIELAEQRLADYRLRADNDRIPISSAFAGTAHPEVS